jgi:hypothetical protein
MVWEAIFMLVILKIPIVYLCVVVWWAIRAEPRPEEGAALPARLDPLTPCDWRSSSRRSRPLRPRRGPGGGWIAPRPVLVARAEARR